MRNERTQRMLRCALERQSGVQNYVFGDLTADLRLRRERCAHAALKRLVLGKHHVRVLTCAGCGESILNNEAWRFAGYQGKFVCHAECDVTCKGVRPVKRFRTVEPEKTWSKPI